MEGFNQKRIEKMITVSDNWYPCYAGNKVKMSLFIQYYHNEVNYHFVRLCVWGSDDFGVELDYHNKNYDVLLGIYDIWKEYIFDKVPENVNKNWFYDRGFVEA